MNADSEQRCGIEILAAVTPLGSAFSVFIPSISLAVHAPAGAGRSWPRAGEDQQVIGEHPQPDPPLHPTGASIATPSNPVTAFEWADASFSAGAPGQGGAGRPRAPPPRLCSQAR